MITISNGPDVAVKGARLAITGGDTTLWLGRTHTAEVATRIYERYRKRAQRGAKQYGYANSSDYWRGYQDGSHEALRDLVNEA